MVLTLRLCVLRSSEEKRRRLLYTQTDLLCITEVDSVYCAVRPESLYLLYCTVAVWTVLNS